MWQIRRSMTPDCFSAMLVPAQDKRNVICLYRTQKIRLVRHLHTTRNQFVAGGRESASWVFMLPSPKNRAPALVSISDVRRAVRLLWNADSKTLEHGLQHVNADPTSGDHIEFGNSEVSPATRVVLAPAQRICAKRFRRYAAAHLT